MNNKTASNAEGNRVDKLLPEAREISLLKIESTFNLLLKHIAAPSTKVISHIQGFSEEESCVRSSYRHWSWTLLSLSAELELCLGK
jgi:hypothetical protein